MDGEFHFFSFFEQADEAVGIVHEVIRGSEEAHVKITVFQTILSHYQDQCELLDPHLESIIAPLTAALLERALGGVPDDDSGIRNVCQLLQCVSRVRGHKSVVKFYPVDVKCFMPILNLLSHYQTMKGSGVWETQCQLMLWLSSLTLIPFDLHSLADEGTSVVDRVLNIAQGFLHEAGTVREFACLLLYHLLTRSDMKPALHDFMHAALEISKRLDDSNLLYAIGVTQAVSFVFKHGERASLLVYAHEFWPVVSSLMESQSVESSLLLKKLAVKLVQRLALTLLEPVTPKWRYIQSTSCLGGVTGNKTAASQPEEDEAEYDIPEEIEDIIQVLLTGAADKDTNVRWSAAKGIGRVCARLPKALAGEVLTFVLEMFSDTAEDSSWHGACLSVAELARRGLLLPESIPSLVPMIEKALVYDINRGSHSIGANVRDSASYVCWACARSFDAEIMAPFMPKLAPVLMTTACLDREVNCRRAASAAFQESVGRIGNVPDGMIILQHADYFSLSKRPNAYLTVAPVVAQHGSYGFDFIAHLLHEKVGHWDPSLRQLTADTLAKLVEVDLEYFTCDVLDYLLGWCMDNNLDLRHGACLCLATVVYALIQHDVEIPEDRLAGIANIIIKIEKARLYRGKGGSLMRQAVCKIIESIAASHLTRSLRHRLRLMKTVNECIGHSVPEVPPDALKALYSLSREFTPDEVEEAMSVTVKVYLGHLHSENVAFRRGYTLALGNLPKALLAPQLEDVMLALCGATDIEDAEDDRDAESRSNAVKSLTDVVCECYGGVELSESDMETLVTKVMGTLFKSMEDYSTDRRGDVGSWIRESAMQGMPRLLKILATSSSLDVSVGTRAVSYLIRNSVERISNIRQVAVQNLLVLLEETSVPLPQRTALKDLLNMEEDTHVAFGTTKGVEAMVPLLQYPEFRVSLLEGLIASIGGLEKSLADAVSASLIAFLDTQTNETFEQFMAVFVTLCTKYNRSKRMAGPLMRTMDALCKSLSISERISNEDKSQMIACVKVALSGTSDFTRLTTGASVLTALAFCKEHAEAAWKELLVLLVNRFPFVRKQTAETIYEKLLFQEENSETAALSQTLLEAAWDGPLDQVTHSRDKIAGILQIKAPVRKIRKSRKTEGRNDLNTTDENASYQALVEDFARGI